VAFVIEVFARRIVGWRVCTSMKTDFVLDAQEQTLYARQPHSKHGPIHHSDRGSQYVSIRYSKRLAEAGVEPSVGSKVELPRGRGTGHLPGRTGTKMSSS
jgi:transposase InsO family protein